jgi:hypothetical protein
MIKNIVTIGTMLINQMKGSPVIVSIAAAGSSGIAQPPRKPQKRRELRRLSSRRVAPLTEDCKTLLFCCMICLSRVSSFIGLAKHSILLGRRYLGDVGIEFVEVPNTASSGFGDSGVVEAQ